MVMMALVSAVAGATYAQEATPPAQATAQQAAPAGTVQAPTATSPAPTATSSNAPQATTAATTTASTPTGPSPDFLKKARQGGYQVKVRRGTTLFCKSEASLGTRFVDEKCYNQDQLEMVLEKQQAQRDALQQSVCAGGGACGGGK
jgi:hypothetical protein